MVLVPSDNKEINRKIIKSLDVVSVLLLRVLRSTYMYGTTYLNYSPTQLYHPIFRKKEMFGSVG